jgi:protein gp37
MGDTSIEWTNKSWNPIRARRVMPDGKARLGWHCVHMSEGCRFCYAERTNQWVGTGLDYKPGHLRQGDVEIFIDEKIEAHPLKWHEPEMVFPCSMTDLFGDFVHANMILRVLAVMAMTPHLTYQIVTKRPQRMCEIFTYCGRRWTETRQQRGDLAMAISGDFERAHVAASAAFPLANVWCGTSTEDQETFFERTPWLSETPAAVRFLSVEPMLGPVRLINLFGDSDRMNIDWCIIGCESGREARHFDEAWAYDLIADCRARGVAPFVKQIPSGKRGKPLKDIDAFPEGLRVREWPLSPPAEYPGPL